MKKIVVVGLIVGLIVVVGLIVGAFFIGQTLVDIFLILAALASFAAFALLGYAALQILRLVKDMRGEVSQLVSTAQETLAEVQGTAKFVNATVVTPVAEVAGWVSATRATLKAFTEPLYKRKS